MLSDVTISTLYLSMLHLHNIYTISMLSNVLHGCRMLCDVTAAMWPAPIICRVLQWPGPCPACGRGRCHLLSYFQVIIIGQKRQIMAEKGQNLNTAAPCVVCGHTAVAGWCRGVQVLQPSLASSTPVALQGVHQHRPHSAALRSAARSQHQSAARSTAVH